MRRRGILELGVAGIAVGGAFGLLELVLPSAAGTSTYATASVAIAVAALSAGLAAGTLAVALSCAVVVFAHLPPVGEMGITSTADQIGLLLFAFNGLAMAVIGASLRERRVKPLRAAAALEPHLYPATRPDRLPMPEASGSVEARRAFAGALVEPLTDRELEILVLVTAGLSNEAIATRLYISTNTVKTHLKNIYGKLEVTSRTQAAARAHHLGLFARASVPDESTAA